MLINKVYAAEPEGLGLAEMAGLTGEQEAHYNFLQSFWDYFQADMISSFYYHMFHSGYSSINRKEFSL